jgi:shikimate kinase
VKGITFIGMSGSGKSVVGAAVAERLGWKFIDLDKYILEKQALSHHEIAERFSEDRLKELEEQYALGLDLADTIFAPGGSLVYSPAAMDAAKNATSVIYLRVQPALIEQRLGERLHHNGIVGLKEKGLAGVMVERAPLYERYADYTLDSGEQSVAEMVERVLALLQTERPDIHHALS